MGIAIALWLKSFFRKHQYNFFEILILLCFVMGMGMLMLAVFTLIEGLTKLPVMKAASMLLLFYVAWAIGQFFDKSKVSSYVKAFIAYLLGMVTFYGVAMLLGYSDLLSCCRAALAMTDSPFFSPIFYLGS